jgi:hypothetical protein
MVQLSEEEPGTSANGRSSYAFASRRYQPDAWLAEYTTELLNVLHVLGRLVALEPAQADLLERICASPTLTEEALREAA